MKTNYEKETLKVLKMINLQVAYIVEMLEVKEVVKKRGGQIFRK